MTRARIAPYQTRETFPYDAIYGSADTAGPFFVCMTEGDIELVRLLLAYAKRRINWYAGAITSASYYLGVTDNEMETITDRVQDLEGRLMTVICSQDIVDAIDRNTTAITELQCICTSLKDAYKTGTFSESMQQLLDNGTVEPVLTWPDETISAQQDNAACAIAQLYWRFTYETMTEVVLPAARTTFDDLLPLLAGFIGGVITTPVGGIAVYAIAEMVQELLELGYTVSEENYINWLLSVKEEWVCAAYFMLKDGANASAIASKVNQEVITPSTEISLGDKVATRVLGSTYAVRQAKQAWAEQSSWALNNVDPGFCTSCEEPLPANCTSFKPCTLTDWNIPDSQWLVCNGDYPQVRGGYSIFTAATLTVPYHPDGQVWVKIWYIPRSPSAGEATADFDLRFGSNQEIQVPMYPDVPKPVDVLTSITYTTSGRTEGEVVSIQAIQAGWYFDVVQYCVYDSDPDV